MKLKYERAANRPGCPSHPIRRFRSQRGVAPRQSAFHLRSDRHLWLFSCDRDPFGVTTMPRGGQGRTTATSRSKAEHIEKAMRGAVSRRMKRSPAPGRPSTRRAAAATSPARAAASRTRTSRVRRGERAERLRRHAPRRSVRVGEGWRRCKVEQGGRLEIARQGRRGRGGPIHAGSSDFPTLSDIRARLSPTRNTFTWRGHRANP